MEPTPPRRSTRLVLVVLALLALLPGVLVGGAWVASEEHQVVPGLTGCRFIRARQPQIDCYSAQMRGLVERDGLQAALQRVDERAAEVTTLGADCHLAWHPVGEAAGRAAGRSKGGFRNITAGSTCQQGYAHGYTIGYLEAARPASAELVQIAGKDCAGQQGQNQVLNCLHAYGHSFARRHSKDVSAATALCGRVDYSALPGGTTPTPVKGEAPVIVTGARHQCLYGMYMEFGIMDVAKGSTVLDNCASAAGAEARKACYAYLPSRVGAIKGSIEAAGRSCHELAPPGEPHDSCVKTFSFGLHRVERCTLLVTDAERRQCREVFALRASQRAHEEPELATAAPAPKDLVAPPKAAAPTPGR